GLRMGAPMASQGDAWLVVRLEPTAIAREFGLPALAPRVLRLDPALPFGYPRDLELLVNTLPPDRHRGYAVQWFGLAATLLVIALVLTFHRSRR
ncbi:SURF1 family cytochrome oxidase biogenesis protein, partial [Cognatilysobacter segetis]